MSQKSTSLRVRVQKFGGTLSAMVMPNIPAFIAWGIITALFIPTGWYPNENLGTLVGPTLTFLMPILIGYTGGYNLYGMRGGVAGAIATIGVVIGADITMLIGGMVMGPLGALLIKKVDEALEGSIPTGMEMLVSNFSLGIIGGVIMILGYLVITPIFNSILTVLAGGVEWMIAKNLLPFASLFVVPGQVLFLNNAINHGIMIPIGIEQAQTLGKSILFLVEANGGPWTGLVLAYALFARGDEKSSAVSAFPIMFLGGIGEVAFPYALVRPWAMLGPIAGNIFALFMLQLFNGGTVAAVSPGSIIALVLMTPKGAYFANLLAYIGGGLISMAVVAFFLIGEKKNIEEIMQETTETLTDVEEKELLSLGVEDFEGLKIYGRFPENVKSVVLACDGGMGSSAMAMSLLKNIVNKEGLDIKVTHNSIARLDKSADLIITTDILMDRVISQSKNTTVIGVSSLMDKQAYQKIVSKLR